MHLSQYLSTIVTVTTCSSLKSVSFVAIFYKKIAVWVREQKLHYILNGFHFSDPYIIITISSHF
jgi:hypothetical protein